MMPDDETFVASALKELATHLDEYPIELLVSVRELTCEPDILRQINRVLIEPIDEPCGFSTSEAKIFGIFARQMSCEQLLGRTRLLVYCHQNSPVAKAARGQNPSALWGATCSKLAAVYKLCNKVPIWHEALHLLGAEDCYKEDNPCQKKPDCTLNGCIMEYAACENTCERKLFLCDRNIRLIRQLRLNEEESV